MDINEIKKYLDVSSDKSVCVDRRLVEAYPGFVRDIVILNEIVAMVEFNVHDCDEGGLAIKLEYNSLDEMISSVEKYLSASIAEWENYSKTGSYPELVEEVDFSLSGDLIKNDFINNKLELPSGSIKFEIQEGYWRDLYDRKIGTLLPMR